MAEQESGLGVTILKPDANAQREWLHKNKSMVLKDKVMGEADAIRKFVYKECYLATELYGSVRAPMSLCREIVRQGFKDIDIAGQGVMETECLIAGGCVRRMELTYQGWEVYGISSILRRAVESGKVTTSEWSNASLAWRLKAAAMGIPFIPTRSMLGTDTFKYSEAKTIECPFTGQKLVALPASVVDVGIIHVHRADQYGNCQIDGITGFAWELARASRRLIISCEEIVSTDEIRKWPDRTIIPWFLVDAVVHAPFGSFPGEMCYYYERDKEHIQSYVKETETQEGTDAYMAKWVYGPKSHAELLEQIGPAKMEELRKAALRR
jgi:acyl CoA:acetate/3-ketoacid CoA transferase alpha subunit